MQFDFSALDRELEALGQPADNALALARQFASANPVADGSSAPLQLDDIDRTLAALESDGGVDFAALPQNTWVPKVASERPRAAPPSEAPRATYDSTPPASFAPDSVAPDSIAPPASLAPASIAPGAGLAADSIAPPASVPPDSIRPPTSAPPALLTQSQEIVLPDPIAREELSTESGELRLDGEASSGSFELPETPTVPRIEPHDIPGAVSAAAHELSPFDDVQDALEGSQPIMLEAGQRESRGFGDRDPDAEFDALLSEATDPRGIPTGGGTHSAEIDTDDLLRGLEGDELPDTVVSEEELAAAHDDEPNEAELLTRSIFEDNGDSTEVIDRNAFSAPVAEKNLGDEGVTLDDELDSGELEIVMEDDDGATLAPPPGPQSSKAPPPPPPPADKRPSLLGRLFNKRDNE